MPTSPGRHRAVRRPRTLAETLRSWDDETLAVLLQSRPDLARPLPADSTQVASRAATRLSVSAVLERLDSFHLGVCEALLVLDAPVTAAAVRRVVHAPSRTVTAALEQLRAQAVVWGTDSDLQVVRAVGEVLGPQPAGLGPPVRAVLRTLPGDRLRTLGADLSATLAVPTPSAGSPPALADETAEVVVAHLRELVDAATGSDPGVTEVLARLTPGPPSGRLGGVRPDLSRSDARGPVEHLLALGLLVAVDTRTVVLPREMGLYLRGGHLTAGRADQPPQAATTSRDPSAVERTGAGAAYEAVRRVEHLLDDWAARPPAVLRGGGLGVRDLRLAAATLHVEESQAGFWAELAHVAGLAARAEDDPLDEVWRPTRSYDSWVDAEVAVRWTGLVRAWMRTDRATALIGSRDDRGRPVNPLSPDLRRASVPPLRRAVLDVLAAHSDTAPDPEDVAAQVAWLSPRRSALRDGTVHRTLVEAGWLGVTGNGALSRAGRELLAGADDAAVAAVLRPLLPRPVDALLLQADLTAVAPGPLEREVGRAMALLADVESRGAATVYRFTPSSLRRALDAGWTGAEVHAFLAQHARTPVPQPLTYLVDDISRRHGHVRVGAAGVYLRSEDPSELDALVADRALAGLGLRRIAATVVVSDSPADLVLARLRATSRAPVAEGPDGAVTLRAEGASASRRAPLPLNPPTVTLGLSVAEATAVVSAVRAGDRAASARPDGARAAELRRSGSLDAVAALRDAAQTGSSVWLAYLDQAGALTERIVDPVRVESGWLTAHDHRSGRAQSFALHRVSRVGPA